MDDEASGFLDPSTGESTAVAQPASTPASPAAPAPRRLTRTPHRPGPGAGPVRRLRGSAPRRPEQEGPVRAADPEEDQLTSDGTLVLDAPPVARAAAPRPPVSVPRPRRAPEEPAPALAVPPARSRKKLILGGTAAGALLAAAIGVVAWLNAGKIDPRHVKEELKAEIDRINAIPAAKVDEKYSEVSILIENEVYKKYGGESYAGLLRAQDLLREEAETNRKAREKVGPFIDRYESLRSNPARLRKEAQRLRDECRPLREQFAATSFASRLDTISKDLDAVLASGGEAGWEGEFIPARKKAEAAAAAADFAGALEILQRFGAKFHERETPELAAKLDELRSAIRKKGSARIDTLLQQAKRLLADGRGTEAKSLIEGARPGLKGMPRAGELDSVLGGD